MKPDSELQEALRGLIRAVRQRRSPAQWEANVGAATSVIESLFERRVAELESLLDRTRNLANANLAEMDAKVSLLEAARNDLLLVVEELNDLRKTAEANSLTREEWDMVISRLATHDVRFGLSEKPAQLFRKLHALRLLSEEKP